jgi:chromosome segregation ATPase
MPPKGYSTKKEIEKLKKEPALTQGSLQDKKARISDLETEHAANLDATIDKLKPAEKENVDLKTALGNLQAELQHERDNRADAEIKYQGKIANLSEQAITYRMDCFAANRRYKEICEQNIALREALKKVL